MLTTVTLYGPLAKEFGRDWELAVDSPAEAVQLIEANKPGFMSWIRGNLEKYDRYKVIVDYHDGRKEHLDEDSFKLQRTMKRIRFVPIVTGAGGGIGKVILGALLLVAAAFTFFTGIGAAATPYLLGAGMALTLGGITELLSPKPKKLDEAVRQDGTSYFFDGPVNTSTQGVPVPLIYGTVLAGSQAISAKVTVDQLL
jgi:predicted phage tail protein